MCQIRQSNNSPKVRKLHMACGAVVRFTPAQHLNKVLAGMTAEGRGKIVDAELACLTCEQAQKVSND